MRLLKQKTVDIEEAEDEVFNPGNNDSENEIESNAASKSSSDNENDDANLVPISTQAAEFDGELIEVMNQVAQIAFFNRVEFEERSVDLNQSFGALDLDENVEYDLTCPTQEGVPYFVVNASRFEINIELGLVKLLNVKTQIHIFIFKGSNKLSRYPCACHQCNIEMRLAFKNDKNK